MGTVIFKSSVGMAHPYPESSIMNNGPMSSFGFPVPLKKLHRSLQAALQKIPAKDEEGNPLREKVMGILSKNGSEKDLISAIAPVIAMEGARADILEKRINDMSPADFIVDPKYATPDEKALESVKDKIIGTDMKRFAKVLPVAGKPTDEWDHILDEDGPSF